MSSDSKNATTPRGAKLLMKHANLLRHMSKVDPETLQSILNGLNDEMINLISQICYNLMHKNLDVDAQRAERELGPHRQDICQLMNKKTSAGRKRNIVQKGGFIGTLLSIAVPSIISGIVSLIKRH